jgi:predicted transcriptional regulator of viral defense system
VYPDSSGPIFRSALIAAGLTDKELRRLRSDRRLTTIRPGVYATTTDEPRDDAAAWHALAVRAAAGKVAADAVVSHASAAVLHGLTLWNCPLGRVHVTRSRRSGGRRTRHLHVHAAALAPDEIVEVDGIPVTSVERTVVDIARDLDFEPALVTADAALFRGRVTPAELAAAVARAAGRTGNPAARRVVAAASGLSESPGETRSRVAFARAGIPTPVQQYPVGAFRADFWWEEHGTVGSSTGR